MTNKRNAVGKTGKQKGMKRGQNKKGFGRFCVIIQAIASFLFMIVLIMLDMLPLKYLALVAMVLLFMWSITLMTQIGFQKGNIPCRILSLVMVFVLLVGTYYIGKTNNMLAMITNGNFKIDKMVVAVPESDMAQSIEDAMGYTFGVQFEKGASNMQSAISEIQDETGTSINAVEYDSVQSQAAAIMNGEVNAVIYNEAYEELMEQAVPGFRSGTKKIYEMTIKAELNFGNGELDDSLTKSSFSVYISGIDTYGEVTETSRSDVNIIAVVNPVSHQILLVTTPRDYHIPIPGISDGMPDKLTHAGIYGIDASMATLGSLYETDINYYVRLNFTSMIDIINILGGVDVYSEYAFSTGYESGCEMEVQQGYNHLDGVQALAFCRERHNLEGGDLQRGKNQQAMITAMLKKVLSPTMLLKANSIMNQVSKDVETNISQGQLNSLVKMQLSDNPSWTIQSVAAEGELTDGYCYSSGNDLLSIIEPSYDSVNSIIQLSNTVEEGGILVDGQQLN